MSAPSRRPLALAALLLATSSWGSLFLVGKSLLAHLDPLWLTVLRYGVATLLFGVVLALRGIRFSVLRPGDGLRLAGLGLLGYGMFGVLVLFGLQHSVPSHGAVVMATMPITTQFVRWCFDGQRPAPRALWGSALGLAGVLVVSGALLPAAAAGHSTLPGDLMAFVGTLGWIAYTRSAAAWPSLDALGYSGFTALLSWPWMVGVAVLASAAGWVAWPSAEVLGTAAPSLLYMGVLPTFVAVLAWTFGQRAVGVVVGTAFLNVVPVSALLMAAALGKPPAPHEWLGVAMVVTALLLVTRPAAAVGPTRAGAVHARHSRCTA